jgi:hypothetical protein
MPDPVPGLPGAWGEALRDVAQRLQQPAEGLRQLLGEVVARAVAAVGAREGSILVPDEADHLQFLVSHSPTSTKLAGLRVPIAGSIAGCVFGTGQMTAVGDITSEHPAQFYAEIDRQVGVATRTYLAVPILLGSQVSGVATYVNRPGEPPYRPFQKHEMELARAFAAIEGVLLRHWTRSRLLAQLAAHDLSAVAAGLSPEAPAVEGPDVPWLRALQEVESLPEDDQALCADLIGLVARRRS